MSDHIIVGIHITDRVTNAGEVQALLTRHGACIRTRLGLHDSAGETAGPSGLILLETIGSAEQIEALSAADQFITSLRVRALGPAT